MPPSQSDSGKRRTFSRKPPAERAMIVTAWIHPADLAPFHRLRQRFFPDHRNYLSAHVTLFHYIRPAVRERFMHFATTLLEKKIVDTQVLPDGEALPELGAAHYHSIEVRRPFLLGGGVAYALDPAPLIALREPLRAHFAHTLKPQDAQPWRKPHITVQNKVDRATAKRLQRHLDYRYRPCQVRLVGLSCYRYDYGPWTLLQHIPF